MTGNHQVLDARSQGSICFPLGCSFPRCFAHSFRKLTSAPRPRCALLCAFRSQQWEASTPKSRQDRLTLKVPSAWCALRACLSAVLTVRAHLLLFCSAMDTLATALRQMALASLMRTLKLHRQIAATVERKTRPPGTTPTTVRVAAVLAVWQCLIVRRAPQIQTWCRTFSPGSTVVTMFT